MARAILPSPPPFRKKKRERRLAEIAGRTKEKETRGRREEGEGRDIRSGVSAGTTEDIALCFLSGQMIYRVSPYIAASYYNPAKTRKGLRESPWVGDGGEGMASRKRNGRGRGRGRGGGREWSGKASRTIWEVLHIYGLLVRARKQISGKSW